jgi:hypothetical protein
VLDILRNVTPVKAEYTLTHKLATDQKAAAA